MAKHPSFIDQTQLYLCTDGRASLEDFCCFAEAAFSGGVDIIQLRDKKMEAVQELEYLAALSEIAQHHQKAFAVNDRIDIALFAKAPVLHLGQGDVPILQARGLVGDNVCLGISTHSIEQAQLALNSPADYFCIGPVWPTATKPVRAATGLNTVKKVAELSARSTQVKPWFAIGDICLENVAQVIDAGAQRIVVVRAITQAPDPAEAAYALRQKLPKITA